MSLMERIGLLLIALSLLPTAIMFLALTTRPVRPLIWLKPFLLSAGLTCLAVGSYALMGYLGAPDHTRSMCAIITGIVSFAGAGTVMTWRVEILKHFRAGPSRLFGGTDYNVVRKSDCETCISLLDCEKKKVNEVIIRKDNG